MVVPAPPPPLPAAGAGAPPDPVAFADDVGAVSERLGVAVLVVVDDGAAEVPPRLENGLAAGADVGAEVVAVEVAAGGLPIVENGLLEGAEDVAVVEEVPPEVDGADEVAAAPPNSDLGAAPDVPVLRLLNKLGVEVVEAGAAVVVVPALGANKFGAADVAVEVAGLGKKEEPADAVVVGVD